MTPAEMLLPAVLVGLVVFLIVAALVSQEKL